MNRIAAAHFPAIVGQSRAKDLSKTSWGGYGVIAFCLAHIPLAILEYKLTGLSTLHALAVFGLGMWWALTTPDRPVRIAYVGGYITGAEVLWRMTESQVFWEFGKYATVAIFLLAIFRSGRLKAPPIMVAYFALLVPSIGMIVMLVGFERAKGYVSFNLSGPLAMTVAAWFFSRHKLSVKQIQGVFLAAVAPVIGIAAISVYSIQTVKETLVYTDESNYAASGGFGPNQVSAALGMGALFALMVVLLGKTSLTLKLTMLVGLLFMAAQSALTFSRGGLYNSAGAVAFASLYLLRDARTRRKLLVLAVILFVLGSYVILPRLESASGGKLTSRFTDTGTTNRGKIAMEDLDMWREAPVLGVGPGGSGYYGNTTAHTEFTRLPAEHGTFGALALLLLLIAAFNCLRKPETVKGKAIVVCLIGWSFLYMLNAAMRLNAPAFTFGLAFATILPETSLNPQALRLALKFLSDRMRRKKRRRLAWQRSIALGRISRTGLR
jgi:O-Antigen ligase